LHVAGLFYLSIGSVLPRPTVVDLPTFCSLLVRYRLARRGCIAKDPPLDDAYPIERNPKLPRNFSRCGERSLDERLRHVCSVYVNPSRVRIRSWHPVKIRMHNAETVSGFRQFHL